MWDRNSEHYNQMAFMELPYTARQIDVASLRPTDTMLDIGCGPGRITTQVAPLVAKVTAIDSSVKMLEFCDANCQRFGLDNVECKFIDWFDEDIVDALGTFDVVFASRTVALGDVERLSRLAKRVVVTTAFSDDSIPEIQNQLFAGTEDEDAKASKRPFGPPPRDRRLGYNVFFNIAYDAGYDPNIKVVTDGFTKDFASRDEAISELRKLRPFSDDKLPVFEANVAPYLTDNPDGTVNFTRETRSFVLWWEV
jgi:SAM-dependent methyltransferase